MTPLAVGDICEVLPGDPGGTLAEWHGRTVTVSKVLRTPSGRLCYATDPMPTKHPRGNGWRFRGWWRERLRKINPPDWAKLATNLAHHPAQKPTKRPLLTLPK